MADVQHRSSTDRDCCLHCCWPFIPQTFSTLGHASYKNGKVSVITCDLFLTLLSCLITIGFKLLLEVFSVIHGPQEECVRALKNGHLLAISPGGVREALFSDETYPLLWGERKGFAQVAIDSGVVRCFTLIWSHFSAEREMFDMFLNHQQATAVHPCPI